MISPPERYQPERIDPAKQGEWLAWSLNFFSEAILQNPHLDLTLQLDLTAAYSRYTVSRKSCGEGTFFAYLVWHLAQTLAHHPSFNFRRIGDEWYLLHNPPIFIPVAIGGSTRFREIVLEDVYQQDYPTFLDNYLAKLAMARNNDKVICTSSDVFDYAHFMGNLPNLRFTGMTLHWRSDQMHGQSFFYFGQRYYQGDLLLMPLSVKLHHACTDFFVLNELIADFTSRWLTPSGC